MSKLAGNRIREFFTLLISRIAARTKRSLSWLTYNISKIVTGALAVGGALCGLTTINNELQTGRVVIAGFAFIVGLPLGLMIFGPVKFSMILWFGIVVGLLFLSNIHSAWEVILSLKNGSLDYIMAEQAVIAVENVTPTEDNWYGLSERIKRAELNLQYNNKLLYTSKNRFSKRLNPKEAE